MERKIFCWDCNGKKIVLGKKTLIMGILNVTPDSFSGDGIYKNLTLAVETGIKLVEEGADIIDTGGQSTRPGSVWISKEEEYQRTIPVIRTLSKKIKVPISVDTTRSSIAEAAVDAGAGIINNIRGLSEGQEIAKIAAKQNIPIVIMHIKGTPKTMQKNPHYKDLLKEIINRLKKQIDIGLKQGLKKTQIAVDPGIGFGKTPEHNLEILRKLDILHTLGCPVLIGTSRKSFIGKILNNRLADERIFGTAATVALAILKAAHIVRVHDVAQMRDVCRVSDAICFPMLRG
ncbi:dihydropteroate synthase [bacterium Unc6]|nr:dihydropteroate synthase [bacterium Unc6]